MSTSDVSQIRRAAAGVTTSPPGNGDLAGLPGWWSNIESAFKELLTWPDDWDSYGAAAPRREAVDAARDLLSAIVRGLELVEPHASPTRDGGVLLEWRRHEHELDLSVESSADVTFAYENLRTAEQVCGESNSTGENVTLLTGVLEHFCR
jgi:hypothetical protein